MDVHFDKDTGELHVHAVIDNWNDYMKFRKLLAKASRGLDPRELGKIKQEGLLFGLLRPGLKEHWNKMAEQMLEDHFGKKKENEK